MAKKYNTLINDILESLNDAVAMLPRPLESPYAHVQRMRRVVYKEYYDALYSLHKRGVVIIEKKGSQNFVRLTEKGVLENLLVKANVQKPKSWDGKWRLIVFDIPEENHLDRDRLRSLLKRYGFYKFQASVFIHPYPLNREAIEYLKETGLNKFIRILKVEEIDNDTDLKKYFGL